MRPLLPLSLSGSTTGPVARVTVALAGLAAGLSVLAADPTPAHACGCFVQPDPTVPIVQAGERILFAMEDGVVTSHIQIQYAGDPEEFAWLVPMPAVPTLGISTDELFTQLINTTQPRYRLLREDDGYCDNAPNLNNGRGGDASPAPPAEDGGGPLVLRDTVGPYDYAVLRADDKQPMLDWLNENRFFVPAGTDDAVVPYIREGAYFLALKLRKGQSVGDLQPVVVQYESELPMIPIVLTSVAADPDMPVLVWVVGDSRAIPRNYRHTKINDARIDWINNGANYIEVVTRAVDEADGHHSFITEYAGTASIMQGVLDPPSRFGDLAAMRDTTDPVAYVAYLVVNGYATQPTPPFFTSQFSSQTLSVLQRHLPIPPELAERGVEPQFFYFDFAYYYDQFLVEFPDQAETLYADFDPVALTDELEERVVAPTLAAGQLFRDHDYLTRLFTTMSPDEMTRDPVFSFNPDLPEVSNIHEARLIIECRRAVGDRVPAKLITEQGWVLRLPAGAGDYDWLEVDMPDSLEIQILREEGAAESEVDNRNAIGAAIDDHRGGGCSASPGTGPDGGMALLLLAIAGLFVRRRRRA